MKRILCVLGAFALAAAMLFGVTACSSGNSVDNEPLQENIIEDKYDNYYEIFVYSFCDSDGNGIGDFNGVTSKLDYIRDMGYTGIWLMPIHPSNSYHKYDVKDYYKVDSQYGKMEDFENLLTAAHEKGIKIIIDLVVNHTSSSHPWFLSAISAFTKGTSSEYADFYNFSYEKQTGYAEASGVYYEARFDSGMPDLNLDSENVRAEISNVITFWLNKGVDGFRLDACTSYYTSNTDKSAEFAGWIQQEAQKVNPDAYVVGEVWSGKTVIESYYKQSGADSFFCFPAAETGYVFEAINGGSSSTATNFFNSSKTIYDMSHGHIPAPFLCNHDTGRAAGTFRRDMAQIKFAYGLMSTFTGNTFTYYGDEIGMVGSGVDPNKRIGMLWDNAKTGITKAPPGATTTEYVFDGVAEQLADSNSILNYYKMCNNVRNAFPEIMRGTSKRVEYADEDVLIMEKTYNSSSVTIVINFSTEQKKVEAPYGTLQKGLCVSGRVKQSGGNLTMPSYSIAILK